MAFDTVLPKDPHHMPARDSWQNLAIIIGIVGGFSLIAAGTGFLTACCRRRVKANRAKKQEGNGSQESDNTNSTFREWSTASTDIESTGRDPIQEKHVTRQEDLLAKDVFKGRELRVYTQELRDRRRRLDQRSSVQLPVHVRQLTRKVQQLIRSLGFSDPVPDDPIEALPTRKVLEDLDKLPIIHFKSFTTDDTNQTIGAQFLGTRSAFHERPATDPSHTACKPQDHARAPPK